MLKLKSGKLFLFVTTALLVITLLISCQANSVEVNAVMIEGKAQTIREDIIPFDLNEYSLEISVNTDKVTLFRIASDAGDVFPADVAAENGKARLKKGLYADKMASVLKVEGLDKDGKVLAQIFVKLNPSGNQQLNGDISTSRDYGNYKNGLYIVEGDETVFYSIEMINAMTIAEKNVLIDKIEAAANNQVWFVLANYHGYYVNFRGDMITWPENDQPFTQMVRVVYDKEAGLYYDTSTGQYVDSPDQSNPELVLLAPADAMVGQMRNDVQLQWNATPTGASSPTDTLEYEVRLWKTADATPTEPLETTANKTYQLPYELDFNTQYTWQIKAIQKNSLGGTIGRKLLHRTFRTTKRLVLELSTTDASDCGAPAVATITSYDEDINTVQLWKKRSSGGNWLAATPTSMSEWIPLIDGKIVLPLNPNMPGVGNWVLRAQGIGDAAKSDEKAFHLVEISFTPSLTLEVGTVGAVENEDYVCTNGPTTRATYTVDIDFGIFEENFSEIRWDIEIAAPKEVSGFPVIGGATSTAIDWEASKVSVDFATECTKYATLTVFGTKCEGAATYSKEVLLNFTLDTEAPTIEASSADAATETHMATISFCASDTKGLDISKSYIEYKIEKGQGSVGPIRIDWDTSYLETVNNTNGHPVTVKAIFNGGCATLTFDSTPAGIDGATYTATAFVKDKATVGLSHEASPVTSVFMDDVYLMVSTPQFEGFADYQGEPYLTPDESAATVTICFIDYSAETGAQYIGVATSSGLECLAASGTKNTKDSTTMICTGYDQKVKITQTATFQAKEGEEGPVSFTMAATDKSGNATQVTVDFVVDTKGPRFSSFVSFSRTTSENSYFEFTFKDISSLEDVSKTELEAVWDTGSVKAPLSLDSSENILAGTKKVGYRYRFDNVISDGATVSATVTCYDLIGNQTTKHATVLNRSQTGSSER